MIIQTKPYYYDCKHEDIAEPLRGKMNAKNPKEVIAFVMEQVYERTNTDKDSPAKIMKNRVARM